MFFAVLAGSSLGAGLLGLMPVLRMVLAEGETRSLPEVASRYNAELIIKAQETGSDERWLIPQPIIDALPSDPFQGVALMVGVLLVLTALGAACNFLHMYLSATVVTRAVASIRAEVFRHVVDLPLTDVFQHGPSQLVARIIRDTTELRGGLVAITSKAVSQIVKGLGGFVIALILHPGLTMIAIVVLPGLAFILRKLGRRIRRGTKRALEGQAGLLQIASETLQGLRAVKANTAEQRAAEQFARTNDRVVKQELRVRTAKALASPLMEVISVLVLSSLALLALYMILQGSLTVDRFFVTLLALGVAGASFRPVAGFVNEAQAAAAPAGRLLELLRSPVEEDGDRARPELSRHCKSLEFDAVCYTYPRAERRALDKVTLRIVHGERVAIVGPNGSGKTTLLGLVPRLLVPDSGAVLIDGIDIAKASLRSLRGQIGVVTQETVMFHGTIAENIAYGVHPVEAGRDRIMDAAKRAHAHEFIERIPGGYDAHVLEQGTSLSGGQRQRIAIARAIMRDPAILILDEATSQIDAESEARINDALKEFCKGRTSLIIAHRLSTVLGADRIVVMDEGRIVDQGTHEQLLSRCDLYARLSHTQLAGT